jgi:hypothetical protein
MNKAAKTDDPQSAYAAAVLEFNRAAVPLIVALSAQVRPSDTEVIREVNARAAVVKARRRVWDTLDHG